LLVGVQAGVDVDTLVRVISASSGGSTQLTGQLVNRALRGRFEPGFMTALLLKDMRLAADLAAESGQATPVTDAAASAFAAAVEAGHGRDDYSAILLELEKRAGVEVRLRE
jgi:3-hydroxyisobutyrate dehydrogenase-like beta-hydroxyacid dehydrogenase